MYTFETSERNNQKATEFETKSLLFLMTKIKGHNKIDLFVIDCFNDVTGTTKKFTDSWDVQSKNIATLTPGKIGSCLYTLFANFISDIHFGHFILFMPQIKDCYLKSTKKNCFYLDNFNENYLNNIRNGLINEYCRRKGIKCFPKELEVSLDTFINQVIFVCNQLSEAEYIKSIIQFQNLDKLNDDFLESIFKDIRNKQAVLKIKNVYKQTVESLKDVIQFNKNITRKEIEILVINRIIGNELFSEKGIPLYFSSVTKDLDIEDIKDLLIECQSKISKTLFNKNNKRAFWLLLERIVVVLENNLKLDINTIYNKIGKKLLDDVFTMDKQSVLYLIAIVKEGLENENN